MKMNSKEARGYVHLAGCECQGTTRKALDIVLSDSEKLERIEQIVKDYYNGSDMEYVYLAKIREVLENE
jgi:hypothetical protein